MKFKIKPGWTKESMKAQIRAKNNGSKSTDGSLFCLYRTLNSNACAAGCFIPDELYNPQMETTSIDRVVISWPQVEQHLPLEIEAMVQMQTVHDNHQNGDVRDVLADWIDNNCEEQING